MSTSGYRQTYYCKFSTSALCRIDEQSRKPTASSLPFGELLQEAEQKQKEKEQSDEEKERKRKRKEKIKRIQKWAMLISGGMMLGSALFSIYEMGKKE